MTRIRTHLPRPIARLFFRRRLAVFAVAMVACGGSVALWPGTAAAWNPPEHIRFPDQAYQIMNIVHRSADNIYAVQANAAPLSQCPASVSDCGAWNAFMADVRAAPTKLDNVASDLSDLSPALAAPNCAGRHPTLPAKTLATCRAGDVPFPPARQWAINSNLCYLRPNYVSGGADQNIDGGNEAPFYEGLASNFTGAILGQWATRPDDETSDVLVWIRPSSTALNQEVRGIAETSGNVGIAVALAPVVCLAEFLFGGGDCIDDSVAAGRNSNLLNVVDTTTGFVELYTAGQVTRSSTDAPFTWFNVSLAAYSHFTSPGNFLNPQSILTNQFNRMPGFKEVEGGALPGPAIDALDVAIIAAMDFLGVTVQPNKSNSVANYSPFDDGGRRELGDWINPTVGHVEFEPVQNLAAYGWQQYRVGDAAHPAGGARGLGWVMHALADAGEPHHTISALGWGHQQFEDFANMVWHDNFNESDVVKHYADLQQILLQAFHWWQVLTPQRKSDGTLDLPVRDFVQQVARETFFLPVSTIGSAFIPLISIPVGGQSKIHAAYDGETGDMKDLMERSIGATLAFLARAVALVPGGGKSCICANGSARLGQDAAGAFVYPTDGACHACGTAPFQNLPLLVDGVCLAICPPDRPTPAAGGQCAGPGACAAGRFVLPNGACTSACPAGTVVVNNRTCVNGNTCPPGTVLGSGNFCLPQPAPTRPPSCGSAAGDVVTCTKDADCCSKSCFQADHVCRSRQGETCASNDNCLSHNCLIDTGTGPGSCGPGPSGAPCISAADCLNQKCLPSGHCSGVPGDPCQTVSDCDASLQCTVGTCCIADDQSCGAGGGGCCNACSSESNTCFSPGL